MSERLTTRLAEIRRCPEHVVGAPAPAGRLAAVERELGRLPRAYRELLDAADGLDLWRGRVTVWSTGVLVAKNRSLRSPGGWFSTSQVFVGESAVGDDLEPPASETFWAPDYFYFDGTDGDDPPVRFFHLTPTSSGIGAPDLGAWIDLVIGTGGLGAPVAHRRS